MKPNQRVSARLFFSLLLLSCYYPLVTSAEPDLKISYFQVPPHVIYNSDSGVISGALYDLLRQEIAPRMKVNFVWDERPSNIPRQMISLESNKRDVAALFIFTPDRAKKVHLSETHYYRSSSAIYVLRENPTRQILSLTDLLPMRIGYAQSTYLSPLMRDSRLDLHLMTSPSFNQHNLQKLLYKRIDAVYAPDKASLMMEVETAGIGDKVKLLLLPEQPSNFHLAFSKNNQQFANQYDLAFIAAGGTTKYQHLLKRYIQSSKFDEPTE